VTIRAGKLDVRIALQRKTTSLSNSGTPFDSWSNLSERWAELNNVQGDERNAAQQWIAREQVKFTIRYSSDIADLSPLDRIVFPANDAINSPPPIRSNYDIISVLAEGRNEKLVILAARQVG